MEEEGQKGVPCAMSVLIGTGGGSVHTSISGEIFSLMGMLT